MARQVPSRLDSVPSSSQRQVVFSLAGVQEGVHRGTLHPEDQPCVQNVNTQRTFFWGEGEESNVPPHILHSDVHSLGIVDALLPLSNVGGEFDDGGCEVNVAGAGTISRQIER